MAASKAVIALALAICLLVIGLMAARANAIGVGEILKVAGIGFLVTQYGEQIDSFITSALGERGAAAKGATKVVPILSLGAGGHVGAAQVVGNPEYVKQVKAVFQLEGRIGSFRPRIYVPAGTDKATQSPERIKGVGVSAVIEFAI